MHSIQDYCLQTVGGRCHCPRETFNFEYMWIGHGILLSWSKYLVHHRKPETGH